MCVPIETLSPGVFRPLGARGGCRSAGAGRLPLGPGGARGRGAAARAGRGLWGPRRGHLDSELGAESKFDSPEA